MELGCQVLLGYFGPVNLFQVIKNDDEERCFYKNNLALANPPLMCESFLSGRIVCGTYILIVNR